MMIFASIGSTALNAKEATEKLNNKPVLADGVPISHRPLGISPEVAQGLINELM